MTWTAAAFLSPTMPRTWPDSLITASRQDGQSCSVTLRRSCSYMTSFIRDTETAVPQRSHQVFVEEVKLDQIHRRRVASRGCSCQSEIHPLE